MNVVLLVLILCLFSFTYSLKNCPPCANNSYCDQRTGLVLFLTEKLMMKVNANVIIFSKTIKVEIFSTVPFHVRGFKIFLKVNKKKACQQGIGPNSLNACKCGNGWQGTSCEGCTSNDACLRRWRSERHPPGTKPKNFCYQKNWIPLEELYISTRIQDELMIELLGNTTVFFDFF